MTGHHNTSTIPIYRGQPTPCFDLNDSDLRWWSTDISEAIGYAKQTKGQTEVILLTAEINVNFLLSRAEMTKWDGKEPVNSLFRFAELENIRLLHTSAM